MERWTKEEEKYLIDNYMTEMYCDIAQHIGKTEGAIRAKCFDLNLVKNSAWSYDEIEFIKNNYQKMSIKEMAEYLNRTTNAVRLKANRCGCKRSPYNCDYDFFQCIDTEEKAYWFGFIASDGWISVNESTNSGCLGIELQASDVNHLKKFNKSINGNYKISERERLCEISTKPNSISKECCIRIFSINMVNDLINIGITSDKTHEFQFPIWLDEELYPHFIRGYFDGDGCVRTRTRRLASGEIVEYPVCDIISANKDFLDKLRTLMYEKYGICSYIYMDKNCYRLYVHKNEHTIAFLNYMYHDAHIYLDRKYKKYLSIINNNTTHESLAN